MCIHVVHLNCQDGGHNFIANFSILFSLFLSGNSIFYFLFEKISTKWCILIQMRLGKTHDKRFTPGLDSGTCLFLGKVQLW